jgi:hypothetical protein
MFSRVINGYDVATGKIKVKQNAGFMTDGPAQSLFREGNGTVQTKVIPTKATFNTTTNEPNPVGNGTASPEKRASKKKRSYRPMPMAAFKRQYQAEFDSL